MEIGNWDTERLGQYMSEVSEGAGCLVYIAGAAIISIIIFVMYLIL